MFSLFKSRKARRSDQNDDDAMSGPRMYPWEPDGVTWVADPAINKKAGDFIDRIHNYISSDTEPLTVTVNPAGKGA